MYSKLKVVQNKKTAWISTVQRPHHSGWWWPQMKVGLDTKLRCCWAASICFHLSVEDTAAEPLYSSHQFRLNGECGQHTCSQTRPLTLQRPVLNPLLICQLYGFPSIIWFISAFVSLFLIYVQRPHSRFWSRVLVWWCHVAFLLNMSRGVAEGL